MLAKVEPTATVASEREVPSKMVPPHGGSLQVAPPKPVGQAQLDPFTNP